MCQSHCGALFTNEEAITRIGSGTREGEEDSTDVDEMIFVPHAPLFVAAANANAAAAGVQAHVSRKAATAREGGRASAGKRNQATIPANKMVMRVRGQNLGLPSRISNDRPNDRPNANEL